MDEVVTAAEANRHFSRLLRSVQAGRSVTVTSHGRPVARIVPCAETVEGKSEWSAFLDELAARPAREGPPLRWTRDELYERD